MTQAVLDAITEQRIVALEQQIASLSSANSTTSRAGGRPPKPTGLVFSRQPGVIAFEWDETTIADLKNYRIQISTSAGMTNATEYTSVDARFTYYGGVAGVTYYARVAARNRGEKSSDFTATVATTVGTTVATADATATTDTGTPLMQKAETVYNGQRINTTDSDIKLDATTSLSVTVDVPTGGTWQILVMGSVVGEGDNNNKSGLRTRIWENGVEVGTQGAGTHADLATGRQFGSVPIHMNLAPTNGSSYQYTMKARAYTNAFDSFAAGIYTLLLRIS
jgi:hypothetical protein